MVNGGGPGTEQGRAGTGQGRGKGRSRGTYKGKVSREGQGRAGRGRAGQDKGRAGRRAKHVMRGAGQGTEQGKCRDTDRDGGRAGA